MRKVINKNNAINSIKIVAVALIFQTLIATSPVTTANAAATSNTVVKNIG